MVRITGLGITLFFGSQVIYGLTYITSPPFGLVTISFQSLASCMILIGILASVKVLSLDSVIRRELYKAGKEFELLGNISEAERQKRLSNTISKIIKESKIVVPTEINVNLDNKDYLLYMREIIAEKQKMNKDK